MIVSDVIKKYCGNKNISFKWPNDVFVNGKKKYYHISRIKEGKGTKVRLTTDFPLKENTNGHVCDILKGMFYYLVNFLLIHYYIYH